MQKLTSPDFWNGKELTRELGVGNKNDIKIINFIKNYFLIKWQYQILNKQ
jgi:hypothetical protein